MQLYEIMINRSPEKAPRSRACTHVSVQIVSSLSCVVRCALLCFFRIENNQGLHNREVSNFYVANKSCLFNCAKRMFANLMLPMFEDVQVV